MNIQTELNREQSEVESQVIDHDLENRYLLLTPGPLSTSNTVRKAMQRDWCTWDKEYNVLVQEIRQKLVNLLCTRQIS